MSKLQNQIAHIPTISILFLLLQIVFSTYSPPDKYFVNCGSNQNVNAFGRNFIGDMNSSASFHITKKGKVVKISNQSLDISPIYHTARVFNQQSSYEFVINDSGTYLVRLHFFPFPSKIDLPKALFDVSASGFLLLHNYSVKIKSSTTNNNNSIVIKEFLLSVKNSRKFGIYFTPQVSSFAFVNAIEIFLAPNISFSPENAIKVGFKFTSLPSSVLETIYRVNVGGEAIKPDIDNIWRNWDPDDSYLKNPNVSKNTSKIFPIIYPNEDSKYIAPDSVYKSARELNTNASGQRNFFNISWSFDVNRTALHLVRFHFCDFISEVSNTINFYLYINEIHSKEINYSYSNYQMSSPFHIDYLVGPVQSGVMNISVGPKRNSPVINAYLNGVEILQIIDGLATVHVENDSTKKNVRLIVGLAVGGGSLICILVVALLLVLKRRKSKSDTLDWSAVPGYGVGSSHSRVTEQIIKNSPVPNLNLGLKISLAEIHIATNNFDSKRLIGRGGFGNVYKGTLLNGTRVAVKRGSTGSGQGLPEFHTEIMVLSKIRHRHLVSLIGYCDERYEMILVYEFMEKGTLRDHLYNNTEFPCLTWKQRLEICIGAARGLHYLHKGSTGGIIHRDVKPTNILLDENHVAKVADFGLSKSTPLDETHVSTGVKGTLGYVDPEYFRTEQLTEKSDVYSFGVVLVEVLCARPAINNLLPREQMNLAEWGMQCKKKGLIEEIVDPSLKGQINPNSLRKFSDCLEKCLQEDGDDRPAMEDVLWDLEYALQLQQTAINREPHEDSTTVNTATSGFILPNLHRFTSLDSYSTMERDPDVPSLRDDFSESTVSEEVFSQLRVSEAR